MSKAQKIAALVVGAALVVMPATAFILRSQSADTATTTVEEQAEPPKPQPIRNIDPATVNANDLYTFQCEVTTRKPDTIFQACGDGGMGVYDIKWSTWSPYGAKGRGIYSVNQCQPSCSEGTRIETPVYLDLNTLVQYKGKYYLSNLDLTPVSPEKVPTELNPQGWDVSEFAVMMNWD